MYAEDDINAVNSPFEMAAILRRGFDVIAEYTRLRDREALLMCGWLGYALHNLPEILRVRLLDDRQHWRFEAFGLYNSRSAEGYVSANFATAFDRVFAPEGRPEKTPVFPPPRDVLDALTRRLYEVCQLARAMWGYYSPGRDEVPPPRDAVTDEEAEWAAYSGLLAELHRDLPEALLNWPAFDADAFRARYRERSAAVPEAWREEHDREFGPPV